MNKITADHFSRPRMSMCGSQRQIKSPTIRKADVANMGWRRTQARWVGRMWLLLTTIWVVRAAPAPAPGSSGCCRRSAQEALGPSSPSKLLASLATAAIGTRCLSFVHWSIACSSMRTASMIPHTSTIDYYLVSKARC